MTGLLVLAGVLSLGWWLARDPVREFVTLQPGLDNRGEGAVVADIDIGAFGETLGSLETTLTETCHVFVESISITSVAPQYH